jgi:ParB-like chromosome segregation protein Spo0J
MKMMDIKMVKIDDIVPYENNPRHNADAIEPVKESIRQFGFKVPMILDKENVIVAGHTRYEAAKALGMTEVPVIYADDLSEEQVRAFRIADNKTADFSMWDNKKLLEELEGLEDFFTGFNMDEIMDGAGELDESDNSPLLDNEDGVMYEVTFRSMDSAKIDRIKEMWESLGEE